MSAGFTSNFELKSQLRVKGGADYVEYIGSLLSGQTTGGRKDFDSPVYEFKIFESIQELLTVIQDRNKKNGLSRLIAGYSWEWKSKKNKTLFDIKIEDAQLRWIRLRKTG